MPGLILDDNTSGWFRASRVLVALTDTLQTADVPLVENRLNHLIF